jgi:hypothetical protein
MNAPMMRRITSWVPIAPLPSASHSALPAVPLIFAWDRLRENDVLLRKGGRPTHGKVRYFRFLQERAGEYASYKSPIDRRLLARELVDSWLRQGGRFCSTVDHGIGGGGGRGAPTAPANPRRAGEVRSVFRVASTEEALQFTRRTLVRHFTPSINKRSKAVSTRANPPPETSEATCTMPIQEIVVVNPTEPPKAYAPAADAPPAVIVDLELATNEAADALCCLRSTAQLRVSPPHASPTGDVSSTITASPARFSLAANHFVSPARVSPTNHR